MLISRPHTGQRKQGKRGNRAPKFHPILFGPTGPAQGCNNHLHQVIGKGPRAVTCSFCFLVILESPGRITEYILPRGTIQKLQTPAGCGMILLM